MRFHCRSNRLPAPQRLPLRGTLWFCLAVLAAFALTGCNGCRDDDPLARQREERRKEVEEARRRELEERKEDFEIQRLRIEPSDDEAARNLVKPGHWITATQVMKANNFDFPAELETAATDMRGDTLLVPRTAFEMLMSRPVSLPKGRSRVIDATYYVPPNVRAEGGGRRNVWLMSSLRARGGGREVERDMQPTTLMPDYQYFFVVLAENPDRYGYVKLLHSVQPPEYALDPQQTVRYYEVVAPKIENRAPLPSSPLAWTSTAYVLWDGLDPAKLSLDQQDALLDWLHWGGQLLISGPDSLDLLHGSFLDAYLPADKAQSLPLEQEAFDELNEFWSLRSRRQGKLTLDIVPDQPPLGVELKLREAGAFTPHTGELAAERRVGRGRVVLSAIGLSDRALLTWKSFDNFFNGALLRRPGRKYEEKTGDFAPRLRWTDHGNLEKDPRLSTTLRYFSRDVDLPSGLRENSYRESVRQMRERRRQEMANDPFVNSTQAQLHEESPSPNEVYPETADTWHFSGHDPAGDGGLAAWEDFDGAASAARESLKRAAGIEVPKAGLVLRVMALYLFVLVPANWVIFWTLGRVEWAWAAAPLIAIVGAVMVVRVAQLDIGFVRSRTEIGVLEAYGDYPRGHLTRYTALYTSLSSGYNLHFDDTTALAQPFPSDPNFTLRNNTTVNTCRLRRAAGTTLSDFQVPSNSTKMVHSEQMMPLGGQIRLRSLHRVMNESDVHIRDAAVLRGGKGGRVYYAWIGELPAQGTAALNYQTAEAGRPYAPKWDDSPVMRILQDENTDGLEEDLVEADDGETNDDTADDAVNLGLLVNLATRSLPLAEGDVRLVGWTDQDLGAVEIAPESSQQTLRTLVLVHLRQAALPQLESDANSYVDFRDPSRDAPDLGLFSEEESDTDSDGENTDDR